jgi:hypothetical protein
MANRLIKDSDSAGVIECQGAITLAKLLQSLSRDTRARLVGATSPGLAEVQHATEHVRALSGVSDVVFFARPDADAMSILLKSLNIADEVTEIKKASSHVRQVAELDITDMANWNVHELRRYARSTEGFPLHGRQISKAKREELIRMLTPLIFPSSSPLAYPPKDMMPS